MRPSFLFSRSITRPAYLAKRSRHDRKVYLDHNAFDPVLRRDPAMLPYFGSASVSIERPRLWPRGARRHGDALEQVSLASLKVKKEEACSPPAAPSPTHCDQCSRMRAPRPPSSPRRSSTTRSCARAKPRGERIRATYLPAMYGWSTPRTCACAIRPDTILVTLMHANSEAGTIQPMREIGRITRERGVPLHVDGVQTVGKVPIDVDAFGIDLLSFSGHKIYGPKGVGGLYIRRGTKMVSVQHGGEHERSRRAGTENVAGIVGLGAAVEIRGREMTAEGCASGDPRPALDEAAPGARVRLNGHRRAAARTASVLPRRESESTSRLAEGQRRVGRSAFRGQCRALECSSRWACRSGGKRSQPLGHGTAVITSTTSSSPSAAGAQLRSFGGRVEAAVRESAGAAPRGAVGRGA